MTIETMEEFKDAVRGRIIDSLYSTVQFMGCEMYEVRKRMQENHPNKVKEYVWKDNRKKNLISMSKVVYEDLEYRFLFDVLGISIEVVSPDISFANVALPNDTYEVTHTEFLDISEMKIITAVESYSPKIITYISREDIADACGMHSELLNLDSFTPGVFMKFEFTYPDNIDGWTIIEHSDRTLECRVYGLSRRKEYPMWVEYLVTSYTMYLNGNERLAFFMAFAALDQYIELQYSKIKMVYEYYANCTNDISIVQYANEKIKLYANENRRIIDDKFKDIMHEAVNNYDQFGYLYNNLSKYEKMRNIIAHCDDGYEDGHYEDLIYDIIQVLYITGHNDDITAIFNVSNY